MTTNETDNEKSSKELEDLGLRNGQPFEPYKIGTNRCIRYWARRSDLSRLQREILHILIAHAGKDGCFLGIKTIAKLVHCSPWSVIQNLKQLKAKGHIDYIPSRGRGHSNHYAFLFKDDAQNIRQSPNILENSSEKENIRLSSNILEKENIRSGKLKYKATPDKILGLNRENIRQLPNRKDLKDPKGKKEGKFEASPLSPPLETTSPENQSQNPEEKLPSLHSMSSEEGFSKGKDIWIERTLSTINPRYGMTKEKLEDLLFWICRDTGDWWRLPILNPEDLCRQIGKGKIMHQFEHRNETSKAFEKRKPKSYVDVIKDDPWYQEWVKGIRGGDDDYQEEEEEDEEEKEEQSTKTDKSDESATEKREQDRYPFPERKEIDGKTAIERLRTVFQRQQSFRR